MKNTLDSKRATATHSPRASNCLPPQERSDVPSYPHAGKNQSTRSTGVRKYGKRIHYEFPGNGSGSDSLQDLWSGPIPHADRQLPPLRKGTAAADGIPDSGSSAGRAGGSRSGGDEVRESRDGGEHRSEDPPASRIADDDPEPAAVALESQPFVFVADRERADDAQSRHARKNLGSAERGTEPLLHPGIGWRSVAGGSVHPGAAAVLAATGLGTVAVHPEAFARDQRPREGSTGTSDTRAIRMG